MTTNNDLISAWVSAMKELKWKHGITHSNFNSGTINRVGENIRRFFPEKFYTIDTSNQAPLQKNWLINFLTREDPAFIGFGIELSRIIDFYFKSQQLQGFSINTTRISIDELRDTLFEVFVANTLDQKNIKINLTDSYNIYNKNQTIEKPLDGTFIFDNVKYIIECQKVYDSKATSLLESANDIIIQIISENKTSVREFYLDSLPIGYIFFKDGADLSDIVPKLRKDFDNCLHNYLDGIKPGSSVISGKSAVDTDEYEILIEMGILNNYEKYRETASKRNLSIVFNLEIKDFSTNHAALILTAAHKFTESEITDRIRKLIELKKRQHNKIEMPKIIFLDLEEEIPSPNKISQHFDVNELNHERIYSITRDGISVCIVSRNYTKMDINRNFKFYFAQGFNEELKNILETII